MPNYVDEPPSFKERFDAIETILAIQRKRLEDIEGAVRGLANSIDSATGIIEREVVDGGATFGEKLWADREMFKKDVDAIKKAVGCILLGLAGQPVNVNAELLESLGFKTSTIIPASAVVKPA